MSSLIPDPPLVISPNLAATIGLEEATLLAYLNTAKDYLQAQQKQGFAWFQIESAKLLRHLPFWNASDLQRILESLRDKGILLVASAPLGESGQLVFAFNEALAGQSSASRERPQQPPAEQRRANTIAPNWQPDSTLLNLLAQRGIPQNFCLEQVPEFVQYWYERGDARHAWGNRFVNHVLREWRQFEQAQNQHHDMDLDREDDRPLEPMQENWTPSPDAMEILQQHAEIPRNFILEAVPEFVFYWRERGERSNTWNSRFIKHIKGQWARYQNIVDNDAEARPISGDWRPNPDVFDVLSLARIDNQFARDRVKEFVIYWQDRGEARASWNSTFIQFIKQQWKLAHTPENRNSTRDRSILDALTDRSWAE